MLNLADQTLTELLSEIGAKKATPGGGAVASIASALAASMATMVVNYSQGRQKLADHATLHHEALAAFENLGDEALRLAEDDAEAFKRLSELWKLPEDDPQRQDQWTTAVLDAIAAPRQVMHVCCSILEQCERLCGRSNEMLKSDLLVAAILAEAAVRAADCSVQINLPLLKRSDEAALLRSEVRAMRERAAGLLQAVEQACG